MYTQHRRKTQKHQFGLDQMSDGRTTEPLRVRQPLPSQPYASRYLQQQGRYPDPFVELFKGTHGLHVAFGLVWLTVLMVQVARHGLITANRRRLLCLSMFWHFLDVIWIGVFTFVYLMGMLR